MIRGQLRLVGGAPKRALAPVCRTTGPGPCVGRQPVLVVNAATPRTASCAVQTDDRVGSGPIAPDVVVASPSENPAISSATGERTDMQLVLYAGQLPGDYGYLSRSLWGYEYSTEDEVTVVGGDGAPSPDVAVVGIAEGPVHRAVGPDADADVSCQTDPPPEVAQPANVHEFLAQNQPTIDLRDAYVRGSSLIYGVDLGPNGAVTAHTPKSLDLVERDLTRRATNDIVKSGDVAWELLRIRQDAVIKRDTLLWWFNLRAWWKTETSFVGVVRRAGRFVSRAPDVAMAALVAFAFYYHRRRLLASLASMYFACGGLKPRGVTKLNPSFV
jgi:hypothetical protein